MDKLVPNLCVLTGRDKHHLIQLCLPIEKFKGTITFPMLCSEKLDGVFCLAYCPPGVAHVYIYSRTGELYTSLNHLHMELRYLANASQCEIIIFEAFTPYFPQPQISGWCRDTKNQHPFVKAYIHDIMILEDFQKGYSEVTNKDRYDYLRDIMLTNSFVHLNLINKFTAHSLASVYAFADEVWEDGGEGVVLQDPFGGYQAGKRNGTLIKIKKGVSFDLRVVALEEGKGKYVGKVGKLVCRDAKGTLVKVGSGLTDQERSWWWTEFGYRDILNKIVQIDAMAVSSKGVLREPRFKGIRHDKTEVDTIA